MGSVLLGMESEEETSHLNQHYLSGLGKVSDVKAEDLAPTKEDDDYAQSVIDNQNIVAILSAHANSDLIAASSSSLRTGSQVQPGVGDQVNFTFRSEQRSGTVTAVSNDKATCPARVAARTSCRLCSCRAVHVGQP